IATGRKQVTAIWGKQHCTNGDVVQGPAIKLLAGSDLMQLHETVGLAHRQPGSIRGKGDRLYSAIITLQGVPQRWSFSRLPSTADVPESKPIMIAARGKQLTVRG